MISSQYSCGTSFPGNIFKISGETIFKTALEGLFLPSKCPFKVSTNVLSFMKVLFLFIRLYEQTTQKPFFYIEYFVLFAVALKMFFRKEVSFSLVGIFPIVSYLVQTGFMIFSNLFILVASWRWHTCVPLFLFLGFYCLFLQTNCF